MIASMTNSFQLKGESVCAKSRWAMPDPLQTFSSTQSGRSAVADP
jgi:hypothetical protein